MILDRAAKRPTGTERVVPIRGGSANEPRRTSIGGQEDAPPVHELRHDHGARRRVLRVPECGETGGCG